MASSSLAGFPAGAIFLRNPPGTRQGRNHKKPKDMFWTPLTEEEMKKIVSFIENDDMTILDTDIPQRLAGLHNAVQKKIADSLKSTLKENAKLSRRMQEKVRRAEIEVENGDFADLAFDSVDIAKALLYCIHLKDGRVTRTKLMAILYEVYAAWLASHRERLFLEHPVAYEYGPWFWRVCNKLPNVNAPVGRDSLDAVFEKNKGVGVLIQRAAEKYYDHNERDLQEYLLKSSPYRKCTREYNGGKWNKEIPDTEIYRWKKDQGGSR